MDKEFVVFYKEDYKPDSEKRRILIANTNRLYFDSTAEVLAWDILILDVMFYEGATYNVRYDTKALYKDVEKKENDKVYERVDTHKEVFNGVDVIEILKSREKYETAKEMLIIRPINLVKHSEKLRNCVYRIVGDIALVL